MANYTIRNLYQGSYSAFEPSRNYSNAGSFGMTTDPKTANLLKEVSSKLSSGVKHIELSMVSPKVFDAVPQQHLKEIKRLGKLTGVEFSLHGPVIDTTGISQQGFSELNRESAERKIINTLERSHEINPNGNIPVVFHSGEGIPGSEWKTLGENRKAARLIAVEKESGRLMPLEEEKKFYPGEKVKENILSPEEALRSANATKWDNSLAQVEFQRENAERIMQHIHPIFRGLYHDIVTGKRDPRTLLPEEEEQIKRLYSATEYLKQADLSLRGLFDQAYKNAKTEEEKKRLEEASIKYGEMLKINKKGIPIQDPKTQADAMLFLLQRLHEIRPEMYVPLEEFAVNQSAKTFGNAAFQAYKKFKGTAPVINIENPPAGFVLSTAEDLKNLVEASRKEFIKKAVESGELSEEQAKKQAEKLIGATWDLGHINMLRGKGFKEEDIIKQTEIIAPYVKHVHLSDNFGLEHTELPMGMGNVPFKKMMEKLGEKGFEAKKIIEAADWWQHFQAPPFQETLESFGSSIYSTGTGPYWSQAIGLQEGYMGGYGNMLPQLHYEMFGAGFSQLPLELGGQRAGAAGSRMSGRGME